MPGVGLHDQTGAAEQQDIWSICSVRFGSAATFGISVRHD
jgi:hypothetical protein